MKTLQRLACAIVGHRTTIPNRAHDEATEIHSSYTVCERCGQMFGLPVTTQTTTMPPVKPPRGIEHGPATECAALRQIISELRELRAVDRRTIKNQRSMLAILERKLSSHAGISTAIARRSCGIAAHQGVEPSIFDQAGSSGANAPAVQAENPAPQAGTPSTLSGSGCGTPSAGAGLRDAAGAA